MNPPITTERIERDRTLGDWLLLARDGWLAFVLIVIVGVACGLLASRVQPVKYESVGTVVLSPSTGFLDPSLADQLGPLTTTVERLAGTPAVLRPARQAWIQSADRPAIGRARAQHDTAWMVRHLKLQQPTDSSIIEITGSAGTQRDAHDLTSATVHSLATVVNGLSKNTKAEALRMHVFSEADNQGKVSPTPSRNLLIGTNLGILLGIPAALALGAMRRRLRRPQDLAALLDAPLLARVRSGKRAVGDPGLSLARAQMQALGLGERGEIVLITGTVSPERIAEIATRLVRAFTETHRRAVLVDADLTYRSASNILLVGEYPGLADSLNGKTYHERAYSEMVVTTGGPSPVMVVPAGAELPDASASLSDRRLPGVVAGLRNDFDVIILAGPTLDRQSEIVALTSMIDHAVVLTVAGTAAKYLEPARLLGRRLFGILLVDRA
jgi:succinoglycan biosynthesis transport protein ExoP